MKGTLVPFGAKVCSLTDVVIVLFMGCQSPEYRVMP